MHFLSSSKHAVISLLKKQILHLEGFRTVRSVTENNIGLGPIEAAFPNRQFPTGAIHEFLIEIPEHAAASGGFIAAILKGLKQDQGICLWVGMCRKIFPPALKAFGIQPDRLLFIDVKSEKEILWVAEETLKVKGIAAVVAEVDELSFVQSRRLQLAVEQSRVTGFILRRHPVKLNATACVARWKVTPIPGELEDKMPGVGFPRWKVELLKVRNGNPGIWEIGWTGDRFTSTTAERSTVSGQKSILQAV